MPDQRLSGGERLRVLVFDDHALLRRGLVELLSSQDSIEAIDEAETAEEALRKAQDLRPHVMLVDAWRNDPNILDLMTSLQAAAVETKVIVLSVDAPTDLLMDAFEMGVAGLLDRTADLTQLLDCIIEVSNNETFMSKRLIRRFLAAMALHPHQRNIRPAASSGALTDKERSILQLVSAGQPNKAIAGKLYVSEGTVRAHLRSVMRKLNATNRVQAVTIGLQRGLIRLTSDSLAQVDAADLPVSS